MLSIWLRIQIPIVTNNKVSGQSPLFVDAMIHIPPMDSVISVPELFKKWVRAENLDLSRKFLFGGGWGVRRPIGMLE